MKKQNNRDNKSKYYPIGFIFLIIGISLVFMFTDDKQRDFNVIEQGVKNAVGTMLNFIFYGCIFGISIISIMRFMKKLSNGEYFQKLGILITPVILFLFFNLK